MRGRKRGFTLIEIMVVVILISILAGLASVGIIGKFEKARIKAAEVAVKSTLRNALQQFYLDNSFYPTTEQGLEALVEKPTGSPEPEDYDEEGYLDDVPADPWNMPYQYACPAINSRRGFDLWSMGPDRRSGTDDDIVSWRRR